MTPLPLGLKPIPGETLPSYLDRTAHLYDLTLSELLRHLAFRTDQRHALIGYGVTLPPGHLHELANTLALSERTVASMLLTHYHPNVVSITIDHDDLTGSMRRLARQWMYTYGSPVCPDCLRATNAWQLPWKLAWAFICLKHRSLLVDRCPGCNQRPGSGGAHHRPANFRRMLIVPNHCTNCGYPQEAGEGSLRWPCGNDLASATTTHVSNRTLISDQRRIHEMLATATSADDVAAKRAQHWFTDLRAATALLMSVIEPNDVPDAPATSLDAVERLAEQRELHYLTRSQTTSSTKKRLRLYNTTPSPALMAALAPTALAIVDAPTTTAQADNLEWIAARLRTYGSTRLEMATRAYPMSADLKAAIDQVCVRTGKSSVALGLHRTQPAGRARKPGTYPATHVPSILPNHQYRGALRRCFHKTPDQAAQAFCAIQLARMSATPLTFEQARNQLGDQISSTTFYRIQRRLRLHGHEQTLDQQLRRLGRRLPTTV